MSFDDIKEVPTDSVAHPDARASPAFCKGHAARDGGCER